MKDYVSVCRKLRLRILELCHKKRTSHIGGAFSVIDILAVLYIDILDLSIERLEDPLRDRLYYSKGHACTALYSILELCGFFASYDLLAEFTADGSYFTSHVNHRLPGIELSTGSLGHAFGVACGTALACKKLSRKCSIYAILSDGELDEGSNWEAALFAAHNNLDNLTIVIDYNKIQSFGTVSEVMNLEPLAQKFQAFNWSVYEVDGHSPSALKNIFDKTKFLQDGRPKCIIAHTTKGKGVDFMENNLVWHYRSPTDEDLIKARLQLEG